MWGIQMFCLSIISELPVKGVLGVHNIAVRIESLSFLPGFAIGMAASTLVGQYLGARNALMARITIWKCMRYAVIFMTGLGVLFSAFPALFMEIFPTAARPSLIPESPCCAPCWWWNPSSPPAS